MRYNIVDGYPIAVPNVITHGGVRIANITDDYIDAHALGYPQDNAQPIEPEYDATTHKLIYGWELTDGVIRKVATIQEMTIQERIDRFDEKIFQINSAFEDYKNQPIFYNDRGYFPRWIYEYYNSIMLLGANSFPMSISDVTGETVTMTWAEFQSLYAYLVQSVATHTADVNAMLQSLNSMKTELESKISPQL